MSTQVERVPKISIEELLALESGTPFFKHSRHHSLEEARLEAHQDCQHPSKDRLPPITADDEVTRAVGEQFEAVEDDGNTNEAFFMTQPLVSVYLQFNLCFHDKVQYFCLFHL